MARELKEVLRAKQNCMLKGLGIALLDKHWKATF
jgi:hypothetical protein